MTKTKRSIVWESDNANNTSLKEDELLKHGSVEIIGIKDEDGNPVELKDINQNASHGYGLIAGFRNNVSCNTGIWVPA